MSNENLTMSEWMQRMANMDAEDVQKLYDAQCSQEKKPSLIQRVFGYKKEKIPDDIRWAVWERDNYTCKHCGSRRNLTVDHIYPESKGGKLTMENTQTLCKSCNSRKGTR